MQKMQVQKDVLQKLFADLDSTTGDRFLGLNMTKIDMSPLHKHAMNHHHSPPNVLEIDFFGRGLPRGLGHPVGDPRTPQCSSVPQVNSGAQFPQCPIQPNQQKENRPWESKGGSQNWPKLVLTYF
eukprot:EG_transcript_36796